LVIIGILLVSSSVVSGSFFTQNEMEIMNEHIRFSNFELDSKEQSIYTFSEMTSFLSQSGRPLIPKYSKTYTYPLGTTIDSIQCIPKNTQIQSIQKDIYVTPHPIIPGNKPLIEQERSYTSSTPYPETWFSYRLGAGLVGDEIRTILTIELYPLKYTQENKEIITVDSFDITINYDTPSKDMMITSLDDENYEFLILGPYDYQDEIEPLVTHKINRGISTIYVPLSFVYNGMYFPPNGRDEAEQIKNFIKRSVEEWETKNVMLVGGSDDFPTRTTHVFIDYNAHEPELFVSDLYYADLYNETGGFCSWDSNNNDIFGEFRWEGETDEVDLYPDVHLGRLAVTSEDELTGVVNKIISYETQESHKQGWFSNLIVIGGDTFPGDPDGVSEGEYVNDELIDIMSGFNPERLYASNGRASVNGYITGEIEEGAGFVSFAGHGSPSSWSTHPFESENIWIPAGGFKSRTAMNLENNDKLPIVAISACSVGKFNVNDDSLAWSFVSNPNGGGIASFGTTALGYGSWGAYTTQSSTGKMLLDTFRAYKKDGAITFGEMWTRSLNRYISPSNDKYDYKTIEEWQPFGDPTLAIAEDSEAPLKPEILGPSSGKPGEELTFDATTSDPEGDDIYYMFDWGDGTYSEWLGPYSSGRSVSASYTWDDRGDFSVRVKAKDDHGVMGEWSDPLPITMPKSFLFFPRISQLFDWLSSFSFF
jgi:hypothetical protein